MSIKSIIISLRILFRYRLFTGISLIGLGVAVASFWFIANYVEHSYQFDAFHPNSERVYRISMEITAGGSVEHYATTGKPLGELLVHNYPGFSNYATLNSYGAQTVMVDQELFKEEGIYSLNPEALNIFQFQYVNGGSENFLKGSNAIMISSQLALKYFNSVHALDKSIILGQKEYLVKAVFQNWPQNSHLDVRAVLLADQVATIYEPQDWFDLENYTYVMLDASNDNIALAITLDQLKVDQLNPILEDSGIDVKFIAEPLAGLYFTPGLIDDVPKGNRRYVNALAFAGLLVLIISSLNYINLSITQATHRLKEISMKKILGMSRWQLVKQSTLESLLMTLLVLLISGGLVFLFDDSYRHYSGFNGLDIYGSWPLILMISSFIFLLGIAGASYPSTYLSVSSKFIAGSKQSVNGFKKFLLGVQFSIATVIVIATLIMLKQIDFMTNTDLGFSKEQVMIIHLPDDEGLQNKFIQLREQIKDITTVKSASLIGGGALPGEENGKEIFQVDKDGNLEAQVYNIYLIDENYCDLLNIKFKEGRNFESGRISDKTEAVIINEALAQSLNWDNPLGQIIYYGEKPREVIGVVSNFHNKSLHNVIEPIVFIYDTNWTANLLVKGDVSNGNLIKNMWAEQFSDSPFTLAYFDEFIDRQYGQENQMLSLLGLFSIVSILLCCMGLFAIFSLHVLEKTKEMSIRKVLGANALNIVKSVIKSYIMITIIAIGFAVPFGWFFMNNWLSGFSYRVSMDVVIFASAALIVLLMITLTLLYHIIKTIRLNPIEALKNE